MTSLNVSIYTGLLPMCGMEYFESVQKVGCMLSLQLGKAPKKTPVKSTKASPCAGVDIPTHQGGCIGQ